MKLACSFEVVRLCVDFKSKSSVNRSVFNEEAIHQKGNTLIASRPPSKKQKIKSKVPTTNCE